MSSPAPAPGCRTPLRCQLPCLALALCLISAGPARAQEGPYSNFLVGERALGLAGAFVAVADDAFAGFHNPAGIGRLTDAAISGSLWAVALSYYNISDGYRTDLGNADLNHSEERSLPMNLGAVVKFGKPGADGVRPHGFGATVLSPRRVSYRFITQLEGLRNGMGAPAVDRLEVRRSDRAQWYGLSYAYRLSPDLSLGLSAYLADRSVRNEEVELRATDPTASGIDSGQTVSRSSIVDADAQHGVLRLGALWRINRHWQIGGMFQPPGIGISTRSTVDSLLTASGAASETFQREGETQGLALPWELRLGASWLAVPNRLITVDASLFGPVGSESEPGPLVPLEPGDPSPGAFVPAQTRRNVGFRSSLGYEIIVNNIMPVRGGLLVEVSSSPGIPETSDFYVEDAVNTFGVALSFGVWGEGYEISFGTTATFGHGSGLALTRSADPADPTYVRTSVDNGTVFFFVAGGSHAVETFVQRVSDDQYWEDAEEK